MNGSKPICALYAQASLDPLAGTCAGQLEDLRARARFDGASSPPDLVFVEEGSSGAALVRPALDKLRDRAAAGAFDRLYVCGPDRLARDFGHQNLLVDELERAGVEVVFLRRNTVSPSSQHGSLFHD